MNLAIIYLQNNYLYINKIDYTGRLSQIKMTNLYDFQLFNACEDARKESERENNTDNYNTFDSSWNSDSSNDNNDEQLWQNGIGTALILVT